VRFLNREPNRLRGREFWLFDDNRDRNDDRPRSCLSAMIPHQAAQQTVAANDIELVMRFGVVEQG